MEIDKIRGVFVVENKKGETLCMSLGERNGRWYEAIVLGDTDNGRHRLLKVIGSSDGSKEFAKWTPYYNGTIEIPKQFIKEFRRG